MTEKISDSDMDKIVRKLDCTISAGKVRELDYAMLCQQQYRLKARYRPGGKVYGKGGKTNDRSGQARHKVPAKNHVQGPQKTMIVDGLTGKKKMVIDG